MLYQCAIHTVKCPKHIAVVKNKKEFNLYAEKCEADYHCLIKHDHSRLVNVHGYKPKAGSKQTCMVEATVPYDETKMHLVFILINQL